MNTIGTLRKNPLKRFFNAGNVTMYITLGLFIVLFTIGSLSYRGFFSVQVFTNLFIDNSHLLVAALGETMVIISGGIDLSVGSIIALIAMSTAYLVTTLNLPIGVVLLIALLIGLLVGALNGVLVSYFEFQPFIATLTTQFLGRGLCYVISTDTINITNETFVKISQVRIPLPGKAFISVGVVIALVCIAAFYLISTRTRFGRTVYAIGGNEQSARLMGLPVDRSKLLVYVLSGLSAAVAGIIFSLYMLSGYGAHATGLHLDAIAAAVIGGTIMSGGVGSIIGTVIGVLISGIIQSLIMFQGTLNAWWTSIAVAFLLLLFIVIQRFLTIRREKRKVALPVESIHKEG